MQVVELAGRVPHVRLVTRDIPAHCVHLDRALATPSDDSQRPGALLKPVVSRQQLDSRRYADRVEHYSCQPATMPSEYRQIEVSIVAGVVTTDTARRLQCTTLRRRKWEVRLLPRGVSVIQASMRERLRAAAVN